MTESVIEALDNKALGMREAETDGAPVGAAISRPLQDAARSHDDAAGETDCHGPQAALAMTGTDAARVVEDADPYDGGTDGVAVPFAAKPNEVGLPRQRKKEGAEMEFSSALSETEGNGMERVSSDAAAEGPDPGILNHLRSLLAQAEELKRDFPDFDLDAALHDPAFLRLTAPALGVGVREAFYALNRPRLDALAAARAAEESKALLARAVSGGAQRPREGGGSGAAALLRSDYAALPRDRQLALKQRIREAAARGEKMYP